MAILISEQTEKYPQSIQDPANSKETACQKVNQARTYFTYVKPVNTKITQENTKEKRNPFALVWVVIHHPMADVVFIGVDYIHYNRLRRVVYMLNLYRCRCFQFRTAILAKPLIEPGSRSAAFTCQ